MQSRFPIVHSKHEKAMKQKLDLNFPAIAPPEREWAAGMKEIQSRIKLAGSNQSVLLKRLDTCNSPSIVIATMKRQALDLQEAINDLEKHLAMKPQAVEAGKRQMQLF